MDKYYLRFTLATAVKTLRPRSWIRKELMVRVALRMPVQVVSTRLVKMQFVPATRFVATAAGMLFVPVMP